MKILKVIYNSQPPHWVACFGPEKLIYGYVAKTNRFHYSFALDDDYNWDMDFVYVEIDSEEAVRLINSGVGQFDESSAWVVERLTQAEWSLSAEEVLGEAAAAIERSAH